MKRDREKIQKMLDETDWLKVLNEIKDHKSYYVGGGLFVDLEGFPFGFHLNGTLVEFSTGLTRDLTPEEHRRVFRVYKEYKGETEFYKNNWAVFVERKLPDVYQEA